jgi:hypothetical protein
MVHTQLFSELTNRHDGWERQMLEGLTSAYLQETLSAVVQGAVCPSVPAMPAASVLLAAKLWDHPCSCELCLYQ